MRYSCTEMSPDVNSQTKLSRPKSHVPVNMQPVSL